MLPGFRTQKRFARTLGTKGPPGAASKLPSFRPYGGLLDSSTGTGRRTHVAEVEPAGN